MATTPVHRRREKEVFFDKFMKNLCFGTSSTVWFAYSLLFQEQVTEFEHYYRHFIFFKQAFCVYVLLCQNIWQYYHWLHIKSIKKLLKKQHKL